MTIIQIGKFSFKLSLQKVNFKNYENFNKIETKIGLIFLSSDK